MSEAGFPVKTRGQLAAVAELRWRVFVHSLLTTRGKLELVSRAIISLIFAAFALGGAAGLGWAAHYIVTGDELKYLAILLWLVFLFWQVLPLVATASTTDTDSSDLLRFPLSYRSYFLFAWRTACSIPSPRSVACGCWGY